LLPPVVGGVGVEDGPLVDDFGLPPQAVNNASTMRSEMDDAMVANERLCLEDTGTHLRLLGKL
jgi:hypothetical protein